MRFSHLRRWREYAAIVARAVCDLVPGARVYVIGSVAEGRYTVLSDIDILVVVPKGQVRRGLVKEILTRAMDVYGLPWDAPVELHIAEENSGSTYLKNPHILLKECVGQQAPRQHSGVGREGTG